MPFSAQTFDHPFRSMQDRVTETHTIFLARDVSSDLYKSLVVMFFRKVLTMSDGMQYLNISFLPH